VLGVEIDLELVELHALSLPRQQFNSTASARTGQNRGMEPVITVAAGPQDIADARMLFEEYARWLGVDLCFQGFEQELKLLPGDYAGPRGRLFLARDPESGEAAGCIALRPFAGDTGEVKRLYVRPAYRGTGLGAALAARVIGAAREAGYRRLVLDTLAHMQSAIGLYRRLGFTEIPAYYDNPIPGALYFELLIR
jgi:ribosomal protein S18 acetylase RimI-like enzyme